MLWGSGHGSNPRQPRSKLDHVFVVEIRARHVDQFARLLLNRRNHMGMAVTSGSYGDAGRKIEKFVAVNVGDDNAPPALGTIGYERV
jgi:hypothetical protein